MRPRTRVFVRAQLRRQKPQGLLAEHREAPSVDPQPANGGTLWSYELVLAAAKTLCRKTPFASVVVFTTSLPTS